MMTKIKILFVLILFLTFLNSGVSIASNKKEVIVTPIISIGSFSGNKLKIYEKTFEFRLKKYFKLVAKNKLFKAQQKAFEEMDYEECTEEQCLRKIKNILKIDNLFSMQIVNDEGNIQITITWIENEKKDYTLGYCDSCGLKEINNKINELVDKTYLKYKNTLSRKGELYFDATIRKWKINGSKIIDVYYNGLIKNNMPNGIGEIKNKAGIYFNDNSISYKGNFLNGEKNGFGEIHYYGIKYIGNFKDNKKNGKGKITYSGDSGFEYEGDWVNDVIHGYGVLKMKDNEKHTGYFKNGKRHGYGIFIDKYGSIWEGTFKDGAIIHGFFKTTDGIEYTGEFSKNQFNGKGILKFLDGTKIISSFVNDNAYGYGEVYFNNGLFYKGNIVNNLLEGYGELYFTNGDKQKGEFKNGKALNTTNYDSNNKIISKTKNGKIYYK